VHEQIAVGGGVGGGGAGGGVRSGVGASGVGGGVTARPRPVAQALRPARRRVRGGPWPVRPPARTVAGAPQRVVCTGQAVPGRGSRRRLVGRSRHRPRGRWGAVVEVVVVAVLAAAVVVALGLLAEAVAAARTPVGAGQRVDEGVVVPQGSVTSGAGGTRAHAIFRQVVGPGFTNPYML